MVLLFLRHLMFWKQIGKNTFYQYKFFRLLYLKDRKEMSESFPINLQSIELVYIFEIVWTINHVLAWVTVDCNKFTITTQISLLFPTSWIFSFLNFPIQSWLSFTTTIKFIIHFICIECNIFNLGVNALFVKRLEFVWILCVFFV